MNKRHSKYPHFQGIRNQNFHDFGNKKLGNYVSCSNDYIHPKYFILLLSLLVTIYFFLALRKNVEVVYRPKKTKKKQLLFQWNDSLIHGTIIRTRITCKKIPCYMRDSACRWFVVKKAKIF